MEALTQGTSPNPDLQDVVSRMLHANDSRPGFMYEDTTSKYEDTSAAPVHVEPTYTAPVAREPEYTPRYEPRQDTQSADILAALQYERARNEQLSKSAEILRSYETAFEADPALAQGLINYFTTGTSAVPTDPSNSITPSETRAPQAPAGLPPLYRKQIENLENQVAYMRLEQEASELEKQFPGTFQRGPVAQHMYRAGKSSLREAFNDLLGSAVGELIRGQQVQQYQQQMQAWQQQMQAWQQQQYQQQYQQPARTQQVSAPSSVTNVNPPPSYDAVVSRPGMGVPSVDPFDNVKATSWKEAEALMLHDMKRNGFPV